MKKLIYLLVAILAIFSACESDLNGSLDPNNGTGTDIEGCTDSLASNYDPTATIDDGSCEYDNEYCPICEDPECDFLTTGYCENEPNGPCQLCGDPNCIDWGECDCPICGSSSCTDWGDCLEDCPICGDPFCGDWGDCLEDCPLCGDPQCEWWGDCTGCPICGDPWCPDWGNCGPGK